MIAALWQASDSATPQLMDRLYGELALGHSPDVALRTAKMSLLHSDSIFRKPFYWAPFQLYSYQLKRHTTRTTKAPSPTVGNVGSTYSACQPKTTG